MDGYAGEILRINLSKKKITPIPTAKYGKWVGGHGMGSAIFFDLVKDKTIDGFHPDNVITMMTSPLTGTIVPAASGRTEVQGIGVQSYPIGWYTRSNFGGRFSAMLKFAGWDGIVIEGKADQPVWIDIRNKHVSIKNAKHLWGMDTWRAQEEIWGEVAGKQKLGDWMDIESAKNIQHTTQKPAVVAIGPAGENLSRVACLIHDASNAAGQGGFGGVWGSKNLKAVSVIGTGKFKVNDPKALLQARISQKKNYAFDFNDMKSHGFSLTFQSPAVPMVLWAKGRPKSKHRPQACTGCHSGCRARFEDKIGNEASCFTSVFYWDAHTLDIQRKASDLINMYGLNAAEMSLGLLYLSILRGSNLLTSQSIPPCPLDFSKYGSLDFVDQLVKMIAYGNDGKGNNNQFGKDLSAGFVRASKKWGRLEDDLTTGRLLFPYWGLPVHKEPRAQVYWAYGTILGDRDINEHGLDMLKWDATMAKTAGIPPMASAEEAVKIITDKMLPFNGDMRMLDFSEKNIYSEHMVKLVTWHRYYTRFWKQSTTFCDMRWPDFLNAYAPGKIGSTGEAEPKFLNAVTGNKMTFLDGIKLGKKIWNLDHAIWTLQGRHRDMVHFADFIYTQPGIQLDVPNAYLPGIEDGKWDYYGYTNRSLNKDKFDEFKTKFYEFQGWNTATGYPTRKALESVNLRQVADELEKHERLGKV